MTQALTTKQAWEGKLQVVRNLTARGASDAEFEVFAHIARQTGLDPLRKQIYMLDMGGGRRQIVTGIDGFRLIANRSGKYAGQLGPYWCGEDGEWVDVWIKKEPPAAAKVGVMREDFKEPLWGVAVFREYSKGRANWLSMPAVMIAKCAESLAIRKAFPEDLSGVYSPEEMDQAVEAQAVEVEKPAMKPEEILKAWEGWLAKTNDVDAIRAEWNIFTANNKNPKMLTEGWNLLKKRTDELEVAK